MSWDIFGYIGTVVVLSSFLIDNVRKLRFYNAVGSVFWIIYGIGTLGYPTIVVNTCVLLIHSHWFWKNRKKK